MIKELKNTCLHEEKGCCDEDRYSLLKIQQTDYKIIDLDGGWLVLDIQEMFIHFALFESMGWDSEGEEILKSIFYGQGTGGNLRECRHTYWGEEEGYVFYMPLDLIKEAMEELLKYFDY